MGTEDDRNDEARRIFADYVVAVVLGEGGDFAKLCEDHPEVEGELRDLHAKWQNEQPTLVDRTVSVSGLIEKKYGSDDPGVSLDEEEESRRKLTLMSEGFEDAIVYLEERELE